MHSAYSLNGCSLLFTLFLACLQLTHQSTDYKPSGAAPVYVNPNAVPVASVAIIVHPTPTQEANNLITQTVYGFLDFTTTIGNTVMIFSPQSAAPEPPKSPSIVPPIETKPILVEKTIDIKPSKTLIVKPINNNKLQSSVVHVVASKPDQNTINESLSLPHNKPMLVVSSHADVAKPSTKAIAPAINVVVPQKVMDDHKPASVILSSIVEVRSSEDDERTDKDAEELEEEINDDDREDDLVPVLQVENNIGEPEYDFLSRQPSEFAEETYRIHNIAPTKARQKTRVASAAAAATSKQDSLHPTGLVTKLGGTVVKDGATTVHETSVIGTFISGKYAQVLQSTSHIFNHTPAKPKITPTASLRILKTSAPHNPKHNKHAIEPTPARQSVADKHSLPIDDVYGNSPSPNLVRSSRRPATATASFKNRFRNRYDEAKDYVEVEATASEAAQQTTPGFNAKKARVNKNKSTSNNNNNNNRFIANNNRVSTPSQESSTPVAFVDRRQTTPAKSQRSGFKPTHAAPTTPATEQSEARRFKPKVQASGVEANVESSSLYKFRLNRAPGRWQYKTSPKPRVTIRKQNVDDLPAVAAPTSPSYDAQLDKDNDIPAAPRSDDTDLDSSSSVNGDVLNDDVTLENAIDSKKQPPVETLNVEISTPVNFRDTYYEIATIKSPYTFQVGSVRNTRYITVTSTFEKTLDPEPTSTSILTEPLTENILATTAHLDKEHNLLDSSIATLPPIYLSSDQETPPLETLTETFSTTQLMLKTHILPVIRDGGNSTSYTLIQTYHVTRLVTATKTLPPVEAYHFNPSKALKEFNTRLDEAGSELNLELEFGDDENEDEDSQIQKELPFDSDLSSIGLDFDLSEVDKSNIPDGQLRTKKKHHRPEPPHQQPQLYQPQQQQQQLFHQHQQQQQLNNEQLQQLAILRLYNPNVQLPPQLQPSAQPILKYETVFESHVIPIYNGHTTSFSTISRPVATLTKTEYETVTSTQTPQQQQQQQLQPIPPPQQLNPFQQQPQQPQYQLTTAPIVTQTMVTQVKSKILKLTFGAKTAYTTLFSTAVVPTLLTTYITQSVQVQPTAAAFPGFFPAPFAPYPYVG